MLVRRERERRRRENNIAIGQRGIVGKVICRAFQ
jgi:hypothetical protein